MPNINHLKTESWGGMGVGRVLGVELRWTWGDQGYLPFFTLLLPNPMQEEGKYNLLSFTCPSIYSHVAIPDFQKRCDCPRLG